MQMNLIIGLPVSTKVLVVWGLIVVVFFGFWLLERHLSYRKNRLSYSKLLTRRICRGRCGK